MEIGAHIERARATLRGAEVARMRVLARRDDAETVALLVTLGRNEGDLVLPLREGRNFVGRGLAASAPYADMPRPRAVVEQAQWFIQCSAGIASVIDAASTNLSVLCPQGVVTEMRHESVVLPRLRTHYNDVLGGLRNALDRRGCHPRRCSVRGKRKREHGCGDRADGRRIGRESHERRIGRESHERRIRRGAHERRGRRGADGGRGRRGHFALRGRGRLVLVDRCRLRKPEQPRVPCCRTAPALLPAGAARRHLRGRGRALPRRTAVRSGFRDR
jgi:hypothetical protein